MANNSNNSGSGGSDQGPGSGGPPAGGPPAGPPTNPPLNLAGLQWTLQEEMLLRRLYNEGHCWGYIATHFYSRTAGACETKRRRMAGKGLAVRANGHQCSRPCCKSGANSRGPPPPPPPPPAAGAAAGAA